MGGATGSSQCWLVGQPVHSFFLPPTMASVASDEDVFAQFKQQSRKQYVRMWSQFRDFIPDFDFASGPPGEEAFTNFFKSNYLSNPLKKHGEIALFYLYNKI